MSARSVFPLVACLLASACSGESLTAGQEQPIRVTIGCRPGDCRETAQFKEGELPGLPPPEKGEQDPKLLKPTVNSANMLPTAIAGEADFSVSGTTSSDAYAVGVRLKDAGSGYWLVPIGGPDEANPGDYGFRMLMNLSKDIEPGLRDFVFVAFDANGKAGTQYVNTMCVDSAIPDNLNACRATQVPPYLVVSLAWDALVDLDLRVVTPSGVVVDAKHPTTAQPDVDGKTDPNAPGAGVLRPDSNAGCVLDGLNRENLVFKDKPDPGTYYVYANLFDACGRPSVRFNVSLHKGRIVGKKEPPEYTVDETFRTASSLQAVHANGGAGLGLFVTEFDVQ